jgi:hypothetical protein
MRRRSSHFGPLSNRSAADGDLPVSRCKEIGREDDSMLSMTLIFRNVHRRYGGAPCGGQNHAAWPTDGIVNLSGRGMLDVTVARQLGSGNSFDRLLCCPAQAERGRKGALDPLS